MPTITGNIADVGLAVPALARVIFRLSQPAFDIGGSLHVTDDLVEPVDAQGRFSAALPEFVSVPRPVAVFVGVAWWEHASDISARRGPRVDWLQKAIRVPAGGHELIDLVELDDGADLVWEGPTPPLVSMPWHFMVPTYKPNGGSPLPTYTDPQGITITHGELVEWSV